MNKPDLITKYDHCLTLNNYSNRILRSYLNGSHIFWDYGHAHQIKEVTPKIVEIFSITVKS